jgi:hypothetical protein
MQLYDVGLGFTFRGQCALKIKKQIGESACWYHELAYVFSA